MQYPYRHSLARATYTINRPAPAEPAPSPCCQRAHDPTGPDVPVQKPKEASEVARMFPPHRYPEPISPELQEGMG